MAFFSKIELCMFKWSVQKHIRVITVFTVFRLLTDFVCLYNYEFWLSLCKIVRSSVILLLPLFDTFLFFIFHTLICKIHTLISKFYTLICKIYNLICKFYTLICKIHILICNFYTLFCKIYTLICKMVTWCLFY